MGFCVCGGALLKCTFGMAPSNIMVLPKNKVLNTMPIANIMDNKPFVNIMPFGMCSSISNPSVAAATAAHMGVLTPMPCVPVTSAPWSPGCLSVMIANQPALNESSHLMCMWGGTISVIQADQFQIMIP